MPEKPTASGLDPFCQRSSIEIAADVGKAASDVCFRTQVVEIFSFSCAHGHALYHHNNEVEEPFGTTLPELKKKTEHLCDLYSKVLFWWIADHPPACAPERNSVVDEIICNATSVIQRFSEVLLADSTMQSRFVWLNKTKHSSGILEAALSCEIATMSRRPPPSEAALHMWESLFDSQSISSKSCSFYENASFFALEQVKNELPKRWHVWRDMSETERNVSIESLWGKSEETLKGSSQARIDGVGKPCWNKQSQVLEYGSRIIRNYRGRKPALKQWAILQAFQDADWAESVQVDLGGSNCDSKDIGDAVHSLNVGLDVRLIKFARDGTGRGIRWSPVPKKEVLSEQVSIYEHIKPLENVENRRGIRRKIQKPL